MRSQMIEMTFFYVRAFHELVVQKLDHTPAEHFVVPALDTEWAILDPNRRLLPHEWYTQVFADFSAKLILYLRVPWNG
jgi:hypothetical protein